MHMIVRKKGVLAKVLASCFMAVGRAKRTINSGKQLRIATLCFEYLQNAQEGVVSASRILLTEQAERLLCFEYVHNAQEGVVSTRREEMKQATRARAKRLLNEASRTPLVLWVCSQST